MSRQAAVKLLLRIKGKRSVIPEIQTFTYAHEKGCSETIQNIRHELSQQIKTTTVFFFL